MKQMLIDFLPERSQSEKCTSLRRSPSPQKASPLPSPQVVFLKDIVCYLSLLERGTPEDKLECRLNQLFPLVINGLLYLSIIRKCWMHFLIVDHIIFIKSFLKPCLEQMLEQRQIFRLQITSLNPVVPNHRNLIEVF